MTESKSRLGFIGLGLMGQGFTKCLINAGYQVIGYDLEQQKIDLALEHGVIPAQNSLEVTESSDIVIICVTTTQDVNDVVFGSNGVVSGASKGKVLIDHSTTAHGDTKIMASRLASETGMGWVDAPVSGGPEGAKNGTLAIMGGGSDKDIAKVEDVMDTMSETFTVFGPVGSGQIAKMVNQILVLNNYAIIAEALALAEAGGIDASKIPDALAVGYAGSNMLQHMFPLMIDRNYTPRGFARQILKDFDTLHELAKNLKSPTPMSSQASSLYRMLISKGHGELDGIAILKLFDKNDNI
jgi:3-hydroxyisobutyrate dehydrogenase-like beta-hydroxyacid dehydrogenase